MSGRIRMLMYIGVQQGKACNSHLSSCRILLLKGDPKSSFLRTFQAGLCWLPAVQGIEGVEGRGMQGMKACRSGPCLVIVGRGRLPIHAACSVAQQAGVRRPAHHPGHHPERPAAKDNHDRRARSPALCHH